MRCKKCQAKYHEWGFWLSRFKNNELFKMDLKHADLQTSPVFAKWVMQIGPFSQVLSTIYGKIVTHTHIVQTILEIGKTSCKTDFKMVKAHQPATSPSCLPHLINLAQTYDTDCNTLHLLLLCSAWSSSCTQLSQRGDQHTACKHNSLAVCMGEVVFFFKPLPRYFSPQIASITSFHSFS